MDKKLTNKTQSIDDKIKDIEKQMQDLKKDKSSGNKLDDRLNEFEIEYDQKL